MHSLAFALLAGATVAAAPLAATPVSAAPLEGLTPGTVVAGVSAADSAHTDVTAFFPDGSARVLFTEEHGPGFVPEGRLDDRATRAVLAVQHDGAEGASVVVRELATGARRVVGERAVRTQAPTLAGDVVTWVRAAESPARSSFDVVSAGVAGGGEEVRASIEGAWLTPIGRSGTSYLHIASDGSNRIVALRGTSLDLTRALGKGRYRTPALADSGARVLVERGLPGERAEIVDARGVVVRTGLAGMEPLLIRGSGTSASELFVMGAGSKHAALVVIEPGARERTLDLGRAGIATPLAGAHVDGALVVVARLDRGRSLPGEIVVLDARGPRVIAVGGSVEVYGVVGDREHSDGEDSDGDDSDVNKGGAR